MNFIVVDLNEYLMYALLSFAVCPRKNGSGRSIYMGRFSRVTMVLSGRSPLRQLSVYQIKLFIDLLQPYPLPFLSSDALFDRFESGHSSSYAQCETKVFNINFNIYNLLIKKIK